MCSKCGKSSATCVIFNINVISLITLLTVITCFMSMCLSFSRIKFVHFNNENFSKDTNCVYFGMHN